jgi:hypothetical protein
MRRETGPVAEPRREDSFEAIDDTTADPAVRKDSQLIYDALRERRDDLKTEKSLPEDRALSEKILAEARTRSAQISASRGGSSHRAQAVAAGIPWWLIVAWIIAIAAVAFAAKLIIFDSPPPSASQPAHH